MSEAIATEEYKGYTISIHPDEDPESPRDWDNLGVMVCSHRRYDLGDKHDLSSEDFTSWDDIAKYLAVEEDAAVILPLYLYDHSGLRIKVGSFQGLLPQGHAEFDSGQVGFIYATRARLREEYSVKRISKSVAKRATQALEGEVATYDQFLSGQVYGFVTEDARGEHFDSCWGCYSDPDTLMTECKSTIDHYLASIPQEHAEQLIASVVSEGGED